MARVRPIKRKTLWKLSVSTTEEAQEAVAELLSARFNQLASSYTKTETGRTAVEVYLQKRPAWSQAVREDLERALKQTTNLHLDPGLLKPKLTRLRNEDWAESWKRHFKPLEIGAELLIRPSWIPCRTKPGQITVTLDPGMSFGTGQHATTGFCLRELTRFRKAPEDQSFLDIGTGSGILAVCAAKLGYGPVAALDIDPDCITVARANARLNHLSSRVRFSCQDLAGMSIAKQYSVVCANLISNLLLEQRKQLFALVRRGGVLILAGILRTEFTQIQTVYEALGLRLVRSQVEREWRSGSFVT